MGHVDELFTAMAELVPLELYPPDVVPTTARIAGTAFFPGGSGLFLEGRGQNAVQFPCGGVTVLGHNFDSEAGFRASLLRGSEQLTTGTWGNLLALLKAAEVPLQRCFFTNAYMGLCRGEDNFDYRGRDYEPFKRACLSFLQVQIGIQRPRLIVTLGKHVPPTLAQLSPDLSAWNLPDLTFRRIDATPVVEAARFTLNDGSEHTAAVVAITHPSMPNAWRRNPRGFPSGKQGEIELVRAGWRAVG